jgi:hypothetical protein
MAVTGINSGDRLVQATFAEHLEKVLGWDNVYGFNQETFGPDATLGRLDTRDAVLTRDLRAALPGLDFDAAHRVDLAQLDSQWVNNRSTCLTTLFPVWTRPLRLSAVTCGY